VLRTTLVPLFEKFKISAYFSGHDHNLQEYVLENTHYFVGGGGSRK